MAQTTKVWEFNTDLESWDLQIGPATEGTNLRITSDGQPTNGCLQSLTDGGRSDELNTSSFSLTTATFEDLGVPANSTITDLQVKYYSKVAQYLEVSTMFHNCVAFVDSSQTVSVGATTETGTTAWIQRASSVVSDLAFDSTSEASLFLTCYIDQANAKVTGGEVLFDYFEFIITYTPAVDNRNGSAAVSHGDQISSTAKKAVSRVAPTVSHGDQITPVAKKGTEGSAGPISHAMQNSPGSVTGVKGTTATTDATKLFTYNISPGLENWVGYDGTYADFTYVTDDGHCGFDCWGCLQQSISTSSITEDDHELAVWTGTFEDLGMPTGHAVTGAILNGLYERAVIYENITSSTFRVVLTDSSDTVLATLLGETDSTTSWVKYAGTEQSLDNLASDTSIKLKLITSVTTASGGNIYDRWDSFEIIIVNSLGASHGIQITSVDEHNHYGSSTVTHGDQIATIAEKQTEGTAAVTHGDQITTDYSQNRNGSSTVTHGDQITSVGQKDVDNRNGTSSVSHGDQISSIGQHGYSVSVLQSYGAQITTDYSQNRNGSSAVTHGDQYTVIATKATNGTSSITHGDQETVVAKKGGIGSSAISLGDQITSVGQKNEEGTSTITHGPQLTVVTIKGGRAPPVSISHGDNITGTGTKNGEYASSLSHGDNITVSGTKGISKAVSQSYGDQITSTAEKQTEGISAITHGVQITSVGQKDAVENRNGTSSVSHGDQITTVGNKQGKVSISISHGDQITSVSTSNRNGTSSLSIGEQIASVGKRGVEGISSISHGDQVTVDYSTNRNETTVVSHGDQITSDHTSNKNGVAAISHGDQITSAGIPSDNRNGSSTVSHGDQITTIYYPGLIQPLQDPVLDCEVMRTVLEESVMTITLDKEVSTTILEASTMETDLDAETMQLTIEAFN